LKKLEWLILLIAFDFMALSFKNRSKEVKNQNVNLNKVYNLSRVPEGVYSIDESGIVNLYLILGEKKAMLVDTGMASGNLAGVVSGITDLSVIVVNTHGHCDHICGNYQFETIYAPEKDLKLMKTFSNISLRIIAILKNLAKGQGPKYSTIKRNNRKPVIPFGDGAVFDLGGRTIRAFEIPGHTRGSVLLFDEQNRLLFSGDSIQRGQMWMFLKESIPLASYLESLKKVRDIVIKSSIVFPSHTESFAGTEVVDELINGIGNILNGTATGDPFRKFFIEGRKYDMESCCVIYNPRRLFAERREGFNL